MTRRRLAILVVAGAVVLGAVGALPIVLVVRGHRISARFRAFVAERFQARPDCPVPEPFLEPAVSVWDCWDGHLASLRPVTLILGFEPGSRAAVANYIGFYLPPSTATGDAWLLGWKQQVAARGDFWALRSGAPGAHATRHLFFGPPETLPIRADRTADGGSIIAWKLTTLPSREKLEARLRALEGSFALTASP